MVLGNIINRQNIMLYLTVLVVFTLFALSFMPMTAWFAFVEYMVTNPLIQTLPQMTVYFIGIFVVTILLILLREVLT
jgi:hypothetical protein